MDNEQYIKELTETAARSRSNTKRIDKLEERVEKLEQLQGTVAVVQAELANILTTVEEIKADVKDMKAKPGRRWETLIAAVVTALVGFAVGLLARGL